MLIVLIQFMYGQVPGESNLIHRWFLYFAALVVAMTASVSAVADSAINPATADMENRSWAHAVNEGGFYTPLPAVSKTQLIALLRNYQVALAEREEEVSRYLAKVEWMPKMY